MFPPCDFYEPGAYTLLPVADLISLFDPFLEPKDLAALPTVAYGFLSIFSFSLNF